MVGMDSQLKGIILNHTLKSYMITPTESANKLKVTMKFYGGYKYKSPSKRRRDKCRKAKFLATLRREAFLVPIPFLEPGQSPQPLSLGGHVCTTITTALLTQEEQMTEGMKELCNQRDCLAQEAEEGEEKWGKMCSHVHDLIDKMSDLQGEIHQLEQELRRMKEELSQLEARKERQRPLV